MTRTILALAAALLLWGTLSACGGQEENTTTQSSQAPAVSAPEEGTETEPAESRDWMIQPRTGEAPAENSQGEEGQEGTLVLTQQDSGAEAGYEPAFTLYPDGTFELFASFYDGTATITGTYVQQDGSYVLTPRESTAQGVAGSELGEMVLAPVQEGWAYSGGQLGITYDGAVFASSQE